jgi:DNA replication protein DnaC
MKRISDLDITEELNELRGLRDIAAARDPKPFHDSSSITLAALADHMWTEAAGGFLSVKQLPDCGRCSNGFIAVDRGLSHAPPPARPCPHCELPRRRFARVRHACLPLDAKGVSLSDYEWDSKQQADAILDAQAWLLGERSSTASNILLHGKPGNGKTTLLYGLALSALDRGLKVRYTSQTRLFDAEKDSWKGDSDSPFKSWLDGVDLLLLDELGGLGGQAQWTAWWKERSREMLGAIYERWRARKLILVTCTNLEPKQLLSMFDSPAAASRLAEMVRAPIHMTGKDRRLAAWE